MVTRIANGRIWQPSDLPHLAPPPCTTQEIANDLFRFLRLEPWRVNTSQTRKAGGAVMRDSIENADEVDSRARRGGAAGRRPYS